MNAADTPIAVRSGPHRAKARIVRHSFRQLDMLVAAGVNRPAWRRSPDQIQIRWTTRWGSDDGGPASARGRHGASSDGQWNNGARSPRRPRDSEETSSAGVELSAARPALREVDTQGRMTSKVVCPVLAGHPGSPNDRRIGRELWDGDSELKPGVDGARRQPVRCHDGLHRRVVAEGDPEQIVPGLNHVCHVASLWRRRHIGRRLRW